MQRSRSPIKDSRQNDLVRRFRVAFALLCLRSTKTSPSPAEGVHVLMPTSPCEFVNVRVVGLWLEPQQ